MRAELFQPSEEGEARLLILIGTFTGKSRSLEGRTKLAKLDFLLRYPRFLRRALTTRRAREKDVAEIPDREDVDSRMVRYRYGPWDPAYYALLGRLVGKRLVEPTPFQRGIGYRATENGQAVAKRLQQTEDWAIIGRRARLLKKYLDLSGANLTRFVYDNFPEVAQASWGDRL